MLQQEVTSILHLNVFQDVDKFLHLFSLFTFIFSQIKLQIQ